MSNATRDHEDVADATSPLELIEVRFAIEPHMVRLAVTNASARDLDRLREALERVEAVGGEPNSNPVGISNLIATILHNLFDVSQLRLESGIPRSMMQLIESGEPIESLI